MARFWLPVVQVHDEVGSNDMTVRLWDVRCENEILKLRSHTDYVNSVAFSPDGEYLSSCNTKYYHRLGSNDSTIRLWDVKSGNEILQLEGHIDSVKSV